MKLWSYVGFLLTSCLQLAHGYGGAKHMDRLMKEIFDNQGYNKMVRPSHNYSEALYVQVEIIFNSILNLDLKQQIMRTTGFFRMHWRDDLLNWNPEKFGGLQEIIIPQHKVWHPDVAFYNTVEEKRYPGTHETLVAVNYKGDVFWSPAFTLNTACKFDVTKYPFDSNICGIRVFSWMNDNTSVKLVFGKRPVSFALVLENGEYKVEAQESQKLFMLSERTQRFYDELVFRVKLTRRPGYFILSLLMPVMLLAIMCSTSFLLAPDEQDKLTVAITVLLSFTVFLGVIDQDMPETSDNISLLVVYVSCMLAVGFICVLGNVIVIKCDRWESKRRQRSASSASSASETDPSNSNALSLAGTPSVRKSDDLLLHRFAESNNQSDVLILDRDMMSDRSMNENVGHGTGGRKRSAFFKCKKPKLSQVLNRSFFILNLGIVLSLTVLMWVLMLKE